MSVSGGRTLRGLNNLEENKCGRSVNSNEYFFPELILLGRKIPQQAPGYE